MWVASPTAAPPRISQIEFIVDLSASYPPRSNVVKERHESEIHMELLVAMKQRHAGIVGDKIHFRLLIAAQHHYIFHYAGRRFSRQLHKLETVPVQMDGMDVVAGVAHLDPIALALLQMKRRLARLVAPPVFNTVDRPAIEAFLGSILFREGHFDRFVWR